MDEIKEAYLITQAVGVARNILMHSTKNTGTCNAGVIPLYYL